MGHSNGLVKRYNEHDQKSLKISQKAYFKTKQDDITKLLIIIIII